MYSVTALFLHRNPGHNVKTTPIKTIVKVKVNGQLLVMWSAVCSRSPHSHAALFARPHFFMDAPYRPTSVLVCLVVHCFLLRYSPLTPSSGACCLCVFLCQNSTSDYPLTNITLLWLLGDTFETNHGDSLTGFA